MDKKLVCISCKKEISESGSVSFKCPNCLKYDITRCRHCRELASRYVCPSCNFSGPN
ncbi:MAG: zinc finger domain-containing protein [Nanoarchaeota archaeon]